MWAPEAWLGIATWRGFPDFGQFYSPGFPGCTQLLKSVASTNFATPALGRKSNDRPGSRQAQIDHEAVTLRGRRAAGVAGTPNATLSELPFATPAPQRRGAWSRDRGYAAGEDRAGLGLLVDGEPVLDDPLFRWLKRIDEPGRRSHRRLAAAGDVVEELLAVLGRAEHEGRDQEHRGLTAPSDRAGS
jgi:hypothetical protein